MNKKEHTKKGLITMPEWKTSIKRLADDFCISQIKVNKMLKLIEQTYINKTTPLNYHGDRNLYLYNIAQKKLMSLL